jgi:glycosyltransferase involved in cell wall biosynthesis
MNQYEILSQDDQYADFQEIPIRANDAGGRLPQILFITSYPPRECGIATYSYDLINALNNKFNQSFTIKICPLETENERHSYTDQVTSILNADHASSFAMLATSINDTAAIKMVVIQHEFGFFSKNEEAFLLFLESLTKQFVITFHTVLPHPNAALLLSVQRIAAVADALIVMTYASKKVLVNDYQITVDKITVIPHGTHLVPHLDMETLKTKYGLMGKKVLSTFGLLSSGKSIETTLQALPAIVKNYPDVLFLIIGKTHPSVVKQEGEAYRNMLQCTVEEMGLQSNVRFINQFLPLPELLEYLQLTDIYLFTSKDPNQAVSGTFSYAVSSGCPIISTPIPQAKEVLHNDAGLTIDFESHLQLANAVNSLLDAEILRKAMGSNGLRKMAATAWENSAIAHALLFEKLASEHFTLQYAIPVVNLDHIKRMTTHFGMIQFARINHPDIQSGYTLDDNARALVAMCQQFELAPSEELLKYIHLYFHFIKFCLLPQGTFLNYLDEMEAFTLQNTETNLEDSIGRAIWALGFLISKTDILPALLVTDAQSTLQLALRNTSEIYSTRAMAFIIKGLHYHHTKDQLGEDIILIKELADRLMRMYRHEAHGEWSWFESYLTYGNSVLPEAMLCAWLATGEVIYKEIAKTSFDFLLSKTFVGNSIIAISNKTWLYKNGEDIPIAPGGQQPIDIAYTIIALSKFYNVFKDQSYRDKITGAFNWFLGDNHLHQIIYNPCTGGCYDGLEEFNVNLNQGAESSVSYLMARLTIEKLLQSEECNKEPKRRHNEMAKETAVVY